ncbi:stage II sporulation protein M [Microbacterium sp.]|uniref:stage II sporulation protein M n=1 Tax=Microbacterium sp. TaxID=51671 RepID=UPI003A877F2E
MNGSDDAVAQHRRADWTLHLPLLAGACTAVALVVGVGVGALTSVSGLSIDDLDPSGATADAAAIARNNVWVGLVLLTAGIVTCSISSVAIMFANGLLVGKVVRVVALGGHADTLMTGLAPHAGLELLGFAIIAAAAAVPASCALAWAVNSSLPVSVRRSTTKFVVLLAVGLIILTVAALVEGSFSVVHLQTPST